MLHIPAVIIIVGIGKPAEPNRANISVGLPFFASATDSVIIYKDCSDSQLWVIAAKGLFSPLAKTSTRGDIIDLTKWEDLAAFKDEGAFNQQCKVLDIQVIEAQDRKAFKGISLGPQWDAATGALVNVGLLLDQNQLQPDDLYDVLEEEAFTRLAIVCKTHNHLHQLRALLLRHKQSEVTVQLKDVNGAGRLLEEMRSDKLTSAQKDKFSGKLRDAHIANRAAYQHGMESSSNEVKVAIKTNRLIDRAFSILSGIEKADYTAEVLSRKSNRAMRAQVISAADSQIHVSALGLSDEVKAFRSDCSICCGKEQIMSIVLKKLDSVKENTTDFALNFPLAVGQAKRNTDLVSSQCTCSQCSLLLNKSIYQEELTARIPTVEYKGANKVYIDHQLTLAITDGLTTGASGIVQIFMAVLDRTLESKDWCAKRNPEDSEVMQRRQIMGWMLRHLLDNCLTRETFGETGPWVKFREALVWAINDHRQAGLESWIIRYPLAGFCQLIRFFDMLDLPVGKSMLEAVQKTKLLHVTATSTMNGILHGNRAWTYPFLQVIYRGFNAPNVPRDMKTASILGVEDFWAKLEHALGPYFQDVKSFLNTFSLSSRQEVYRRVQIVVFWALYRQRGHATAQTFFQNIRLEEELAPAALDPMVTLCDEAAEMCLGLYLLILG